MLFIFDENFPHAFVEGFSILEKANRLSNLKVQVVFSVDFMGGPKFDNEGSRISIEDTEIIEKASEQNAVIVTHDSDFKRIKHYKSLLIKHRVGFIYFKVPKGKYQYWDIVKAFVNRWEELKFEVSKCEHPFAFEIDKKGNIRNLPF